MSKIKNIFEHTDCISEEMLLKYVADKLSPAEKHMVEKHLIDCEMCSDAVEGLRMIADKNKITEITSELNKNIQNRVEKREVKVIFLQQYRTQLAMAASVVLIVGLVWFFRSNMKELDPASSEKIFADKFEPYKTGKDEKNSTPVTESPALNNLDKEAPEEARSELNHVANSSGEDKKTIMKESRPAQKVSEEATKTQEGYYKVSANEKDPDVLVLAEPKGDAVREESTASDKQKNEADTKAAPKAPPVTTTSTGTSANVPAVLEKNKENENRALKVEEQKQQNTELFAYQTKSGKDRSKGRKSAEVQTAQPQAVATNVTVTDANAESVTLDSVKVAGDVMQSDDAGLAMKKYEQKDFSGAAEDFEKTLAKDPDNYHALFYSSVSYLSTGQTDKAITNLTKVLEKKDGELYDAAQWYLSLAYIKKNDTQNARKNLVELKNNSKSKYQKQADETLREMQK